MNSRSGPGAARWSSSAAMPAGAVRDDRYLTAAVCLFLAALVWFAFGQTLRHEFVNYDDDSYVYQNPIVMAGFTPGGILWALRFGGIGHSAPPSRKMASW